MILVGKTIETVEVINTSHTEEKLSKRNTNLKLRLELSGMESFHWKQAVGGGVSSKFEIQSVGDATMLTVGEPKHK